MSTAVSTRRCMLLGTVAAGAALAGCAVPAVLSAAPGASADRLRIGIASCCDQDRPQPIWDAVLAEAPDHMVYAGDNVYASEQPFDIARLRAAYARQAQVPGFRRLRERIPHSATWDDHDFGLNDGGAEFPHRQASKDAFLEFWAVPADDERRAHDGVYHARWLQRGQRRVQLIVLDTRWWRSALKPTDQRNAPGKERYLPDPDPAKTMLGAAQWAWLAQRLREPADAHLVISSIQLVVDGHGYERWGNLPLERERFYRAVRESGARHVVIASGDRHVGGIYRHTGGDVAYPLWEMTSSGVTHPWSGAGEAGPNRIGPLVGDLHYGLVTLDFGAGELALSLRGTANQVLHEHTVPLAALQPA